MLNIVRHEMIITGILRIKKTISRFILLVCLALRSAWLVNTPGGTSFRSSGTNCTEICRNSVGKPVLF